MDTGNIIPYQPAEVGAHLKYSWMSLVSHNELGACSVQFYHATARILLTGDQTFSNTAEYDWSYMLGLQSDNRQQYVEHERELQNHGRCAVLSQLQVVQTTNQGMDTGIRTEWKEGRLVHRDI
ncbi:unnamed protein product [Victoria cruziana]